MNDAIIGTENLPNVYIEKINVLPRGINFDIEVTLVMVDNEIDKTWYNKISDLKVKCAFIKDLPVIELLNSGELSLFDIQPIRPAVQIESCDEFELFKTESQLSYYKKSIKVRTFNLTTLNVYVSCFVDDLGFSVDLFDKFYGPMSGEKIFVNGLVNTESGYFYYPDTNEEYGGPVHTHQGGYMEGSEHTEEPHSELVYVQEENFKITSYEESDFELGFFEDFEIDGDSLSNEDMASNETPTGPTANIPERDVMTPDGTVLAPTIPNELENPLEDIEIIFPNELIIPPGGY